MTMINSLAKLLKVLNSETDPAQISLAISFSMLSGLLPFFSPANIAVLLIVFVLRVNLSAYFLGTAFFSGIAYLLDPAFNLIGLAVLTARPLEGLWTAMYNSTIWRIQKFNNSILMGSLVFAILFFIPLYFLSNLAIRRYRDYALSWLKKTRIMQMITTSRLYAAYRKVSGWTEGGPA